jgi:radical SAM superfamily enzyme YgiQ (UPF0313 family)
MIRYEGSIWRPPSEARSLILQATVGCSHNGCIFCVSYKNKKYRVRGAEGIKRDLDGLPPRVKETTRRVFLADGNALAMPTDELNIVLDTLSDNLPALERVGVYGYAKDVREKTVDDLGNLRDAGLGIVYFGLETGDDALLRWARKGVGRAESVEACRKIKAAGIPLSITIILGLGGLERSEQHALATAGALNEIDPEYVGALTLMTPSGTMIHQMVAEGSFVPMHPMDILRELRTLVAHLELSECIFRTNHASNYLPVGGTLGRDKRSILQTLDDAIQSDGQSQLRPGYMRGL